LMGGSVELDTKPDRTTFALVLPTDISEAVIPRENVDMSETAA
jgi:nitrogen-specific signal transduction histidine kinase